MRSGSIVDHKSSDPSVLRRKLREVLRGLRQSRGMTLCDISARARISLGYLSEIERSRKEAPSELLVAICYALDVPISLVLREVVDRIVLQKRILVGEVL